MRQGRHSMPYADFTLDAVRRTFSITIRQQLLFPNLVTHIVPDWLHVTLEKGLPIALGSEKARSEFIIAPILLTVRDENQNRIAIYSGQRLDSDPSVGLVGECDFILTNAPALPIIQAPIISIVEAKKNDIESGLGQCAAQMVGAQRVNQREGTGIDTVYGCVTTGETWQFLRLAATTLTIDSERYYINELGRILAVLQTIVDFYPQMVPSA